MGVCSSSQKQEFTDPAAVPGHRRRKSTEAADSKDVDLYLLEDRLKALFDFKILLLGAGESGKSTIVKQLRLIHKQKLSADDLKVVKDSLHRNVVDCMMALLGACEKFGYNLEELQPLKDLVVQHAESEALSIEVANAVSKLYKSKPIQQTKARDSEFWLLDSCDYYMQNIERFVAPDFTPTEDDCVMSRIRTSGIFVSNFEDKLPETRPDEPDHLSFNVVDVGGQRNERRKWIHCFDDSKAILFIVNLAGYNQVLFEDTTKNRMIESLELFKEITHKPMFKNTPIWVFLNKKDLFEVLLRKVPLSKLFPDYTGPREVLPSLRFVENKFRSMLPPGKEVQVLPVTGVVKKDIKYAFEEVKKTLFDQNKPAIAKEVAAIRKTKSKLKR